MFDTAGREWRFYIDDMLAFAHKVMVYTEGLDQAGFVASGLNYDATVRNLELIGESATHIPDSVRAANPQIPWRLIIATRNRLYTVTSVSITIRFGALSKAIFPACFRT
jgi:uncharacterized protein with HEPN domain